MAIARSSNAQIDQIVKVDRGTGSFAIHAFILYSVGGQFFKSLRGPAIMTIERRLCAHLPPTMYPVVKVVNGSVVCACRGAKKIRQSIS